MNSLATRVNSEYRTTPHAFRVAASIPQTPSFFFQRGFWLYNLLDGQRLLLRWVVAELMRC